tara:strand:- start:345 stop:548 length:204 start_codon:yes stop_codon:yes gene_type:complete
MTKTEFKQLQKISDYINKYYNLNTYVNEYTHSIFVSVWNKNSSTSINLEISKKEIEFFRKEFNNTKK